MAEAPRRDVTVVDLVDYLRETLREMDQAIAGMQEQRRGFAIKLAAIEAESDERVRAAAEDFAQRAASNTPYEDAEDAGDLIAEAHRRYVR
jgi:hypothetical protein